MTNKRKEKNDVIPNYDAQLKVYHKIDAIIAFGIFLLNAFLSLLAAKAIKYFSAFSQGYVYLISGVYTIILLFVIILICKKRKQALSTIGLTKNRIVLSLLFGILGCSLIIILKGGWGRFVEKVALGNDSFFLTIIYQLIFVALPEEVIFRGYIGTRMHGILNSAFFSSLATGILWAVGHMPFQMVIHDFSLQQYLSVNGQAFMVIVILHFIFQWGYKKTNSLIAPVLWHLSWNL